ncbi:MAG: hypothetical protein WA485_16030 [Candidatus Sulfotelmatobacter sp.]
MKSKLLGALLLWFSMNASLSFAQEPPDLFQGYDGEWHHVSEKLIALAEATPPEKFVWRPATGVRSTSEVICTSARKFSDARRDRVQDARRS